jgi:hypothetical protein
MDLDPTDGDADPQAKRATPIQIKPKTCACNSASARHSEIGGPKRRAMSKTGTEFSRYSFCTYRVSIKWPDYHQGAVGRDRYFHGSIDSHTSTNYQMKNVPQEFSTETKIY